MKYILEIDFETERHCLLCPVRDEETDDCKIQYCKEFTNWAEQMKNCPLKPVEGEQQTDDTFVELVKDFIWCSSCYCEACGKGKCPRDALNRILNKEVEP